MADGRKGGVEEDRRLLRGARKRGRLATVAAYIRLSGPGWLQSAITLGGGSLGGSLYLGILGGFGLLWLQPFAMLMGVIMLSAIAYVTLSTGESPFKSINRHVNPVLGWGWLIATMMANVVWSLPQFSLATAAVQQNLLPGLGGDAGGGKLLIGLIIAACCTGVVWFYDTGSRGVKAFEILLKAMVGVIMACFFGVVIKMTLAGALDWGAIGRGFIPSLSVLWAPGESFAPLLEKVAPAFRDFWTEQIVGPRRDVIISVIATAVGINMTFLLPYSMLKRRWDRDFRGLAAFDLATGLFIPFVLATGCVVVAAASQFHATPAPGFLGERDAGGVAVEPAKNLGSRYRDLALKRVERETGAEAFAALNAAQREARVRALPAADRAMAATLVQRDASNLARSLEPLTGRTTAHLVFGVGVVGMAVSTIIILMLINGFAFCEMLGRPLGGWPYRLGALMPGLGVLAPLLWTGGKAQFWLVVPASVFGMTLLPIAYFTFVLVMNQKKILGPAMPRGAGRWAWNSLMAVAAGFAGLCSVWSLWSKQGWLGIGVVAAFVGAAVTVHFIRRARAG